MERNFEELSDKEAKKLAFDSLREVKQVVFSTVDKHGNPASRIIDLMFHDEEALYFITCNVKPFYFQLKNNNHVSLTAMTKDFVQIRIQGTCSMIGKDVYDEIIRENPSLAELGIGSNGNDNLDFLRIDKGRGELFDLNGDRVKMQRKRFAFGGAEVNHAGCVITDSCINCGACLSACPFGAISEGQEQHHIHPTLCDECGICYHVCPVNAIELPLGM